MAPKTRSRGSYVTGDNGALDFRTNGRLQRELRALRYDFRDQLLAEDDVRREQEARGERENTRGARRNDVRASPLNCTVPSQLHRCPLIQKHSTRSALLIALRGPR